MSIEATPKYELYRRKAGYSIVDVAARSGIAVRDIAAAERGQHHFAAREIQILSEVYRVPVATLLATPRPTAWWSRLHWGTGAFVLAVCIVLVTMAQPQVRQTLRTALSPIGEHLPRGTTQRVAAAPKDTTPVLTGANTQLRQRMLSLALAKPANESPAMGGQEEPSAPSVVDSAPLAAMASKRGELGAPYGCPVQPLGGQVVMTQGYNVGTHAPAAAWGAVDLAVDGNGDGWSDPSATIGAPVVALHAGIARVVPNNWLAGNYVRLTDELNGWATAYAHLKKLNITNGQRIEPGMVIGWVGTTGYSSGPHLHYEIYHNTKNINPTPFLECW